MTAMQNASCLLAVVDASVCASVAFYLFYASAGSSRSSIQSTVRYLAAMLLAGALIAAAGGFSAWNPNDWYSPALYCVALIISAACSVRLVTLAKRAIAFRNLSFAAQALDELRSSKQRFERALAGSGNGLWEWDVDTDAVWYSSRFRQLLGYESEAEFPNRFASWQNALHPDDEQWVLAALIAHLRQQSAFEVEYRLRTQSGAYRWFSARGVALRSTDGKPHVMSGSIQDIHARKEAEQSLRQLQEYTQHEHKIDSLGQFAGGIAHEFNNLIQAIGGQLQFIEQGAPPEAQIGADLKIAGELVQQAAGLSERLLAFNRRSEKRMEPITPGAVLVQLGAILPPLLGKDIALRVSGERRRNSIVADPIALQQALVNLCINARDAMPDGGALTISTQRVRVTATSHPQFKHAKPGRHVVFSVTDTGSGIDATLLEKIFEPYYSTKPPGKGTGLGLAICSDIVKEHGGFIAVASTLGSGTTFQIGLPAKPISKSASGKRIRVRVRAKTLPRQTVLYAEDDPIVRRNTVKLLRRRGYRVKCAKDGDRAISLFDRAPSAIDAVVLDVAMPGKNGLDVFWRIRSSSNDLPVIFCTADVVLLHEHDVLSIPNTYVLHKPYSRRALITAMSTACATFNRQSPIQTPSHI